MIGSDVLTLFPGSQSLLGKSVSEMVGNDLSVSKDGAVTGTFHHVTGFTDFSSIPAEQEGYYFPFRLTQTGTLMTIKKNGVAGGGKENMTFDPEIILRVTKGDTFSIEVDSKPVITFTFSGATFEEE